MSDVNLATAGSLFLPLFTGVRGRLFLRRWTSALRRSKQFVPSTVRGVPRGLAQTSAELFCPLLCPLSRRLYLRLFDTLFAVWAVPEFHELLASLGVQNGLHRFFDGLPTPLRPGLGLAHQYFIGHLRDALILAHGALSSLPLRKPFAWGEYITRS